MGVTAEAGAVQAGQLQNHSLWEKIHEENWVAQTGAAQHPSGQLGNKTWQEQ